MGFLEEMSYNMKSVDWQNLAWWSGEEAGGRKMFQEERMADAKDAATKIMRTGGWQIWA